LTLLVQKFVSRSRDAGLATACVGEGETVRAALQPLAWINWMVRSTCSLASGWKEMYVAPALAKSGMMRSTGFTIRCTSMGAVTPCLRSASQTIGPMVRFGT